MKLRTHQWRHTISDLVRFREPEHARDRNETGMIISLDEPDQRFVEVLWFSNRRTRERKIFLELCREKDEWRNR